MEISQATKDLCLKIALGKCTQAQLTTVKTELERVYDAKAAFEYGQVLLSSGLLTRLPNLKDVEPEDRATWYKAKNTLIRYIAQYPENASKDCPVYLAMVKARDSINLI